MNPIIFTKEKLAPHSTLFSYAAKGSKNRNIPFIKKEYTF